MGVLAFSNSGGLRSLSCMSLFGELPAQMIGKNGSIEYFLQLNLSYGVVFLYLFTLFTWDASSKEEVDYLC